MENTHIEDINLLRRELYKFGERNNSERDNCVNEFKKFKKYILASLDEEKGFIEHNLKEIREELKKN